MNDSPLYSVDQITKTYERVNDHRLTKKIISNYSTNTSDVRELALSNLNLAYARDILDLGCGYGLFEEKLAPKLPGDAFITGVDLISSNEKAFIKTIEDAGCRGKFINSAAHIIKTFKSMTYDMIIASYSLYFFPELIEEIARVLRPSGVFITITHSKKSLKEVTGLLPKSMKIKGLKPPEELTINRLLSAFCTEDGHIKLKGHFNEVEVIHYSNSMFFKSEDISDCIEYLAKKRPLLFKEVLDASPNKAKEVENHFYSTLQEIVRETGSLSITKDDAIFRAFRPIGREKT